MVPIMVILFAVFFTAILVRRDKPTGLAAQRDLTMKVGVQIICGDCSGDEARPVRTCLDIYSRCDQCGGSSYVLASAIAINSSHLQVEPALLVAPIPGRILPFQHPTAKRFSTTAAAPGAEECEIVPDERDEEQRILAAI